MARQRLGSGSGMGTPLAPAPPDAKKALIEYYSTDPYPTSRGAAKVTGMSHAWCAMHWRKYQEEVEQLNREKVEAWRQEQIRSMHEKLADVEEAIANDYKSTRQYEALEELVVIALEAGADKDDVAALQKTLERGIRLKHDTSKLHTAAQGYYKMLIQLTGTSKPLPIESFPPEVLAAWMSRVEGKLTERILSGDPKAMEVAFEEISVLMQGHGLALPAPDDNEEG